MLTNVSDITYTSIETINAFDVVTGDYLFTLDELQNTTIAQTQEKVDVTGKQGRKLNSLKRNKAVTISGNNGLVSGGLLELQTGGKFEQRRNAPVQWTDYLIVEGNKATTTYKAVGTLGNEIDKVYVKNSDGTLGVVLEQGATVGSGIFTYDPITKELAFNEGEIEDGTEIAVYYTRNIRAQVLDNMSDTYSGKATLYIDAFGEDKCGNIYRVQFYIPKADFNGEFSIEMGDNQTVHAFEAESLAGAGCGLQAKSGMLWTYTVFGAEADDYIEGTDHAQVDMGTSAKPGNIDGKKPSDLIDGEPTIEWDGTDGKVLATLKKVSGWTQFDASDGDGHFFPISLEKKLYEGKEITCTNEDGESKTAVDTEWVLKVDTHKHFKFECDGEVILTLDFTQAILQDNESE